MMLFSCTPPVHRGEPLPHDRPLAATRNALVARTAACQKPVVSPNAVA